VVKTNIQIFITLQEQMNFSCNLKLAPILIDAIITGKENNLPHHCITDKDLHIHVVVLHTKTGLKCRLVDKYERNIHEYRLHVLNFQITAQILYKYI
jgi:hypothetical protein